MIVLLIILTILLILITLAYYNCDERYLNKVYVGLLISLLIISILFAVLVILDNNCNKILNIIANFFALAIIIFVLLSPFFYSWLRGNRPHVLGIIAFGIAFLLLPMVITKL